MEPDMEQKKKSGKPNFDGKLVGNEFIKYFYSIWQAGNITKFIDDNIICQYSKIQYQNTVYEGSQMLGFLSNIATTKPIFNLNQIEVFDTGSRQIQIMVYGEMIIENKINKFNQFHMIVYQGEKVANKWSLTNSILIIS